MKPIRTGIIGYGRSGHGIHANAIQAMSDQFTLAAVADSLAERLADDVPAGCATYQDPNDLLADPAVELVVVASANRYHADHAIAALQAGKHVICEKPFGFTTRDVDAMIEAARRAGRVLQPFQQRRYEPDFQKVRELCASGILGQITFIRISWPGFSRRWDWQTSRAFGGGQLYNNGPHPLDHAMELFGPAQPEVWCDLRRSLCSGDAEDEVLILLHAPGAPTIEIDLSCTQAYPQDRWLVRGTAGSLRGTADELRWKWVDWSAMPERPLDTGPTAGRSYNKEELPWQEDAWTAPVAAGGAAGATPAHGPTTSLYRDLWRTIREGKPQVIPIAFSFYALKAGRRRARTEDGPQITAARRRIGEGNRSRMGPAAGGLGAAAPAGGAVDCAA